MEDKVSDTLLQREYAKQQEKIAELEAKFFAVRDDIGGSEADTEAMTTPTDYRHELQLRDEQLRREMDQRQESFRAEQAVRDKALDDKFSGFFAVQSERDKRFEAAIAHIDQSQGVIMGGFKSLKVTIIVTALTTVLAIVGGIAGFNAMLTSNMISSFQMGRSELAVHKAIEQETPAQPAAPPTQQK